jgi:molybdenum cofactor cytidylyltransferase
VIAAIVLAAGAARRFGSQKLVAPLGVQPLVRWAVESALASRVCDVIVVLGREGDAVRAALRDLPVRFTTSEHWADGMSGSIRAGIAALAPDTDAVVILLGDQPTVTAELIDRLIAAHAAGARPIVAPSYRGERGNPVLFGAEVFPELLALTGDRGARDLIARDATRVELVELDEPVQEDVDTQQDLEILGSIRDAWRVAREPFPPG